ncbi:MAG: hypothetical protein AWU58_729 [Methanohalophilus sp. T328-1]|nr:MAG: hypothetical protein AWU58_729 [Methanohalophilus sp. T328-1]
MMAEFHNTTSRGEAALLNIWTKPHKRRFHDPDDDGNSWQAVYSDNAVEVIK